jgi:hypothetical protein
LSFVILVVLHIARSHECRTGISCGAGSWGFSL